jgi:hypothetical protein
MFSSLGVFLPNRDCSLVNSTLVLIMICQVLGIRVCVLTMAWAYLHAKQDTDRYHLVATMVGGAAQSTTKWAASSVKNLNRNGVSLGKGGDVDGFIVSSTSISRYLKLSQR